MRKPMKMTTITGTWIDALVNSCGQYVRLETLDGGVREGRLSGLRTRELSMFGAKVLMPTDVELNGDPNDTIAIDRIMELRLL